MSARKLPDLHTLIYLRRNHTLKEIGAMYGASAVAVHSLLREGKGNVVKRTAPKIDIRAEKLEPVHELELLKKALEEERQEFWMRETKRLAWAAWEAKQRKK